MKSILKELNLSDEISQKILAKYKSDMEELTNSKNELNKQLELSQNEVKTRDNQLKELSKINVDELNSKIKDFENENKALVEKHNTEIEQLKTDYAIEKALTRAGARNIKATKSLLDLGVLKLDDKGNLTGIDEQISKLVSDENTSFLFNSKETQIQGFNPTGSSSIPAVKDINQMSYAELCDYEAQGGKI